jgi:hypothetical protein
VSWFGRQQRVLNRIEKRLLADDRRLGALFAVFTRLTREDAMPAAERIKAGQRRRLRSALVRRRPRHRASASSKVSGTP